MSTTDDDSRERVFWIADQIVNCNSTIAYTVYSDFLTKLRFGQKNVFCLSVHYVSLLPAALLNVEIKLPAHVAKATGIDTLHPDLYWPDSRIAVEYKGKKDHSEEWHRTNDAIRENALKYRDVTVLSVTKGQFASITGMYAIAKEIADMMGRRVRLDIRAKAHIDLHRNLCDVAHLRQVW